MDRIYFTQAAMFQLATINIHMRKTTGSHYKISGTSDLERLLKEAFASNDPELRKRCTKLFDCLSIEDQQKLTLLLQAKAS